MLVISSNISIHHIQTEPVLVDDETWERARVLRGRRRPQSKRNTKVFYLLQHLVRCGECGFRMGGSSRVTVQTS